MRKLVIRDRAQAFGGAGADRIDLSGTAQG
jgi:hypothetical protein